MSSFFPSSDARRRPSARSLLFATTNHIERLDPALSRPGRMDVWVNFKHATKWQAEGIFKCFFPAKSGVAATANPADGTSQETLAVPKRKRGAHAIPLLSEEEISELARRFADAIPENELSVRVWCTLCSSASDGGTRSLPCKDTCCATRPARVSAWRKLLPGRTSQAYE